MDTAGFWSRRPGSSLPGRGERGSDLLDHNYLLTDIPLLGKRPYLMAMTDWRALESFSFGDSPALAHELAALVLAGTKTATCWAAVEGMHTHVGKRMVLLNGSGQPLAVIETVELSLRRFTEVDAAFAYDEGEGDRTLAYWKEAHRRYSTRLGQFAENMLLYCERFRVIERIDTFEAV